MMYGPVYDASHCAWYWSVQLCIQALVWKRVFSVCIRLVEYFLKECCSFFMSYKCDLVLCQCELNYCHFIIYKQKWLTHTLLL